MRHIFFLFLLLLAGTSKAQPQMFTTEDGIITITPILHSTMVIQWNDHTIYSDPYGGAERFANFPAPDLVLITHTHSDHLDKETLKGLDLENAHLIAPQTVVNELGEIRFKEVTVLRNGEDIDWMDIEIEAIPMYNLPQDDEAFHKKGDGNGYILEIDDMVIYISGDTEGIPEMRELDDIDIAFVSMNLPYTMDVEQAADAVLDFKPRIVYPFHFRGKDNVFADVQMFKRLVNDGDSEIEVRIINWYPDK